MLRHVQLAELSARLGLLCLLCFFVLPKVVLSLAKMDNEEWTNKREKNLQPIT